MLPSLKRITGRHEKHRPVDTRVYADLTGLIGLQHEAGRFNFLPRHSVRSPLYGRYYSRLRGRGLNLEELRQYYPGTISG